MDSMFFCLSSWTSRRRSKAPRSKFEVPAGVDGHRGEDHVYLSGFQRRRRSLKGSSSAWFNLHGAGDNLGEVDFQAHDLCRPSYSCERRHAGRRSPHPSSFFP